MTMLSGSIVSPVRVFRVEVVNVASVGLVLAEYHDNKMCYLLSVFRYLCAHLVLRSTGAKEVSTFPFPSRDANKKSQFDLRLLVAK